MIQEATEPPYVVMKCVGCGRTYEIGPHPQGDQPYCEKDFMPLYTVKAVGR